MALSGSFNTSSVTAYGITTSFTVNWTATQDISSNTSTIAWTVTTVQSPTGSGYKRGIFYIKVTINGHEVVLKNLSINNTSDVQVYNGLRLSQAESTAFSSSDKQYLTIQHNNSSGEATLDLSLAVGVGTNPANVSGSTSTALNTIPRATTDWALTTHIGVIGNDASKIYTNGYFSGAINSRASNNFRHSLTLTVGSTTAEIWSEGRGTGNLEASFPSSAYRLPDTLKRALKNYYYNNNTTSCSCTLNLDTYSNNTFSTKIGTNSKSVTINLIQPSASNFTFDSDSINGISDLTSSTLSYSGLDPYNMYDSITITRSGNSTGNSNWTQQTGTSARTYSNVYTDTYTTSFSGASGSFSLANSAFEEAMIDRIRCIVTASIVIKYGKSDSAKISFSKTYKLYISANHKIVITGVSITYSNKKKNTYLLAGISGISYKFTLNRNNTHASITDYNFTNIGTGAGKTTGASINNSTVTATYSTLPTSTTNYDVGYQLSVTDSRGWDSDIYNPGTTVVTGYVSPSITSASVKRTVSTSTTDEDPKGTYAYFTVTWSKGTNTNSSTPNSATMSITGTTITNISNTSYTGYASSFPDTNSYNFTVTVTDSDYDVSVTKTLSISKFIIPLSLHPDGGVGLGGLAEANKIGIYLNDAWYITKTRNNVLAAPNGSNGNPSWRRLVAADISSGTFSADRIPSLNASKIGSGTLGVARGGTGNTTGTATYATTTADTDNALYLVGVTSGATTTLKRDTAFTVTGKVFDGEIHFKNSYSSYAPEIKDTAPGIGCANKGSRYLVNELLVDGIVAPPTAYSEHSMSTRASTIQFYKYTTPANGQWTDLTKIAVINADGFYRPQGTTFTGTYSLGGLAGVARSSTMLRTQLPLPYNFLNFSGTSVSGSSASFVSDSAGTGMGMKLKMGYYGASGTQEFTVSSVAVGDINPGSVMINITFSTALQPGRPYVIENGKISLSMKAKA